MRSQNSREMDAIIGALRWGEELCAAQISERTGLPVQCVALLVSHRGKGKIDRKLTRVGYVYRKARD